MGGYWVHPGNSKWCSSHAGVAVLLEILVWWEARLTGEEIRKRWRNENRRETWTWGYARIRITKWSCSKQETTWQEKKLTLLPCLTWEDTQKLILVAHRMFEPKSVSWNSAFSTRRWACPQVCAIRDRVQKKTHRQSGRQKEREAKEVATEEGGKSKEGAGQRQTETAFQKKKKGGTETLWWMLLGWIKWWLNNNHQNYWHGVQQWSGEKGALVFGWVEHHWRGLEREQNRSWNTTCVPLWTLRMVTSAARWQLGVTRGCYGVSWDADFLLLIRLFVY